jgi:hypothetical protein
MRLTKQMTKFQLFALLTADKTPAVTMPDGRPGILQAIQREDGSGKSFNLTVNVGGAWVCGQMVTQYETLHVRTID